MCVCECVYVFMCRVVRLFKGIKVKERMVTGVRRKDGWGMISVVG